MIEKFKQAINSPTVSELTPFFEVLVSNSQFEEASLTNLASKCRDIQKLFNAEDRRTFQFFNIIPNKVKVADLMKDDEPLFDFLYLLSVDERKVAKKSLVTLLLSTIHVKAVQNKEVLS